MALPSEPPGAFQYFADFLAQREGVGALALATDDAAAAHAELVTAECRGAAAGVVAPGRESWRSPLHAGAAAAPRNAGLPHLCLPAPPREIVWRPEYQRHPNGAEGINSITIATSDPTRYARLFDNLPVAYAVPRHRRSQPFGCASKTRKPRRRN